MSGPEAKAAPTLNVGMAASSATEDVNTMPELGLPLVSPPTPLAVDTAAAISPGSKGPAPPSPSPSSKPPARPVKPPELSLKSVQVAPTEEPSESMTLIPMTSAPSSPTKRPKLPRRSTSSSSSASASLRSIISAPLAPSSAIHANSIAPALPSPIVAQEPAKVEPPVKSSKPRWLRRGSISSRKALDAAGSSSSLDENASTLAPSGSVPPALPARPKPTPSLTRMMPPPPPPRSASSTSTATMATASSNRRPANSSYPSSSSLPRDGFGVGAIRGKLAAWSAAAGVDDTGAGPSQQRLPATAQKALNTAGSAVSRGWAGLRARGTGAGASISGFSAFAGPSPRYDGALRRGSADAGIDGPLFGQGIVKRAGKGRATRVFGRDLAELTGTDLSVVDPDEDLDAFQRQRRACLPAILVRTVEHLHVWAVKEEGIFRISGRSSHISRLKAEFDAGSDLDLKNCDPGDLDPHAVAGVYKAFLRELPMPILTPALSPDFDRLVKAHIGSSARDIEFGVTGEKHSLDSSDGEGANLMRKGGIVSELERLLRQLPEANWFLLADLASLLASTTEHSHVNKMTLQNVLLVFCPSLSFSAPFLRLLIEHRRILFCNPPEPSQPVNINFDGAELLPPTLPSRPKTVTPTESVETSPSRTSSFKRTPPKLAKKRSALSVLISNSQLSPGPKTPPMSIERSPSVVQVTPPRVELGELSTSPLPSFEGPNARPVSLFDAMATKVVSAKDDPPNEVMAPPAGIVADRAKAFASTQTPIADRFAGTGIPAANLFSAKTAGASTGHLPEFASSMEVKNPASVIRRGQPVFFSSSSASGRPSRSRTVPMNLSLSDSGSRASWNGTGVEGNKRKSLSPGGRGLGVRSAIKALESPS